MAYMFCQYFKGFYLLIDFFPTLKKIDLGLYKAWRSQPFYQLLFQQINISSTKLQKQKRFRIITNTSFLQYFNQIRLFTIFNILNKIFNHQSSIILINKQDLLINSLQRFRNLPFVNIFKHMDRSSRATKPIYEKENQQKFVNKRTDLLSSLHNIKLPLQHSQSIKDNQFQSVPLIASLTSDTLMDSIQSHRDHKFIKQVKQCTLTEEYCKLYGQNIEATLKKETSKGNFLNNHKIDGILRARMLDWMVEVMSSYHFQNKTYFAGVEIMDRFFAQSAETLVPTQLHIIGVQSMFIATKMQQVYPLKMKTVFEKIAHKKISISELSQMENKIAQTLNFELVSSSIFDLAITKIAKHLTDTQSYSESLIKEMEEICGCMAKFIYYNYELVSRYSKEILGQTLARIVLDIYKLKMDRLKGVSFEEQQLKLKIIELIGNFKRKFKGLNNLYKFTDKKILEMVQAVV